ncbi:cupin domain-containing protein [Pollutibacter soli]|uniref:cupin domain-containing protein n=1 Tax=Pollutibacter soli TaxID=3034157 RepID=UPI0030138A43
MKSRRKFIGQSSMGLLSLFTFPVHALSNATSDFGGLVVNDAEGEKIRIRDGTAIVRIKIAKAQGSQSICFLSESVRPGDGAPVHKHMNEDEFLFFHKGSGIVTLGEKQYEVSEGAVILIPKGVWHGWQNISNGNTEVRFGYSPSGFEGYFREVGSPFDQPFIPKTMEERRAIAKRWGMIYKD